MNILTALLRDRIKNEDKKQEDHDHLEEKLKRWKVCKRYDRPNSVLAFQVLNKQVQLQC